MILKSSEKEGSPAGWTKWLEAVLISLLVPGFGYFLNRHDPFFISASFPWVWFGPVLVALRYGLATGLFSVALLALFMLAVNHSGNPPHGFPLRFLLGGLLLTMLCGQFSSLWHQQLERATIIGQHAAGRAEQLAREYLAMRLSHDRLEQNLISRPITLRDAVTRLRRLLAEQGGRIDREVGAELMAILSHYCNIESAALFLAKNRELGAEPACICGRGGPLDKDDPLVRLAMESEEVHCQSIGALRSERQSRYLVAAPMRSSSNELMGLLLVDEMPFLALNKESMQLLGVLLSYCADHALAARAAAEILQDYPDCPTEFALELKKFHSLSAKLGITCSLGLLHLPSTVKVGNLDELLSIHPRGLDLLWVRPAANGIHMVVLMPFSGSEGLEGYRQRLGEYLQQRFGSRLDEAGIASRSRPLGPAASTRVLLSELFEGVDA